MPMGAGGFKAMAKQRFGQTGLGQMMGGMSGPHGPSGMQSPSPVPDMMQPPTPDAQFQVHNPSLRPEEDSPKRQMMKKFFQTNTI